MFGESGDCTPNKVLRTSNSSCCNICVFRVGEVWGLHAQQQQQPQHNNIQSHVFRVNFVAVRAPMADINSAAVSGSRFWRGRDFSLPPVPQNKLQSRRLPELITELQVEGPPLPCS